MEKINILFVCRYNRFRSRIAEAYFNQINKNKKIKAKSAGLIKGNPLSLKTVKLLKNMGIDISGNPKGLSSKLMAWQNYAIIVADDVPEQVFDRNIKYCKKVEVWKIKDLEYENEKGNESRMIDTANTIKDKINDLIKRKLKNE